MNYCRTCLHWKRDGDGNAGTCASPKFQYVFASGCLSDGLAYWDSEDYHAAFCTGESFGCVHHPLNAVSDPAPTSKG